MPVGDGLALRQARLLNVGGLHENKHRLSFLFLFVYISFIYFSLLSKKLTYHLSDTVPTYQDANSTSSHAASSSLAQSAALTLAPPTSSSMPATSRLRSKWDSLKLEDDDDDASGGKRSGVSSGGGIDAFFQKLYADADDDTRRAMMKSYTESGGTSLSTNWAEVGKGEVETRPPEGMEAKKWN